MRFTVANVALLAYTGVSMANICTIVGYTWEDQDVFSGIPGEVYGDEGFELYYQGGVHISGGVFSRDGSAFNSVAKHTIDQHYLHTAESIIWTPRLNGIAMVGCHVSYEGKDYEGYLHGPFSPCGSTSLGYSCSYCNVDFECEGNLPAPN
ncbi:hypothetical protein M441DRAFT_50339 [Trichoderma asperellum CBS 433.97]|uniref:Uncharacterized protein n=2 Tax=Trichoderma asperellum TaxID=101201 RepID=A0A2T3YWV5_TRIA4|nr:hypothetical protein M441DRAFT_50339 [Trichoderma asperellum CBS 433.97]PTB37045.1 hypothetical protein M441DRAFT_50339 [Trichoderma asperellum CBS 433.97]